MFSNISTGNDFIKGKDSFNSSDANSGTSAMTSGTNSGVGSTDNSNPMSPSLLSPRATPMVADSSKPSSDNGESGDMGHDSDHPKKRRKCTSRACDACAIRKVKCEQQRPCKHCVANGLQCTQLRERKKSGPKNLHRKTLASINSLADRTKQPSSTVVEANKKFNSNYENESSKSIIVSNHDDHPIEMVPESLSSNLVNDNSPITSKYTTNDFVEILSLVKEPLLFSILKETTVKTTLDNYKKLISFILYSIPNVSLDLIITSNDPLHLSKILSSLTLALVLMENVLVLITSGFFYSYMKPIGYYNSIKKIVLFKILEIFQMIDRFLLYPTGPVKSFQIFYNQSISCLNLFYYFSISRDHDDLYKEQQKVMYLRRSITYYQMINNQEQLGFSNKSAGEGMTLNQYQLNELFERLFVTEKYNYLTYTNLVNSSNLFDLTIPPNSNNSLFKMFKLLNNDDLIFHKLKSHHILMNLFRFFKINHYPDSNNLLTRNYMSLKINLTNTTTKTNTKEPFHDILSQILLFKVLMIYSNNLQLQFIEKELVELVKTLNNVLVFDDEMYLKGIHFRLLPQLLQILKINIDFETNVNYMNDLVVFTDKITPYFSTFENPEALIRSNKIIFDWFEQVSNISPKVRELFCKHGEVFSFDNDHLKSVVLKQIHGKGDLSFQLTSELNRLQQGQPRERDSRENPKERGDLKDLLNDFGNSRLSSRSITSANSPERSNLEVQVQQNQNQQNQQNQPQSNHPNHQPLPHSNHPNHPHPQGQGIPQSISALSNLPNQVSSPSGLSRQYLPSSTLLPQLNQPSTVPIPLNQSSTTLVQNSNSTSYSTIIQNSPGLPMPPIITSTNPRKKDDNVVPAATGFTSGVNESSKNLYNLFTQMNDEMPSSSNSLTNLFQFNSSNNLSSFSLNKLSSLSNLKSSGNLQFVNSSSALNLFLSNADEEEKKDLKSRFLL